MRVDRRNAPGGDLTRHFQRCRVRFLFGQAVRLILVVALTAGMLGRESEAQAPNEYQVKAAFLYNFAKFVEWPGDAFNDGTTPLTVGVLGDDPFNNIIDQTINGKTINGRQLVIKRFKWGQNLRGCHILFISSSERKRLGQVLESLKGASILTVGEMEKFNEQGGIINFIMEDNKVRFEINTGVAEQARLRISSKLLALAKTVIGERRAGRG